MPLVVRASTKDANNVVLRRYDARIAAALRVHGVTNILTFNVDDFTGFDQLTAVNPADVFVK
jgi:predicted nucleic acid-binding protein